MSRMDLSKIQDIVKRFFGHGVCPHQLACTLMNPLRRQIPSFEALFQRLSLHESSRVLEVRSGPGYFSVQAARGIPKGYLLLIDLQREVVAKAKNWIKKAGVKNFSCIQSDANNLPLANGTFGVVFLVAVLGEVMDRQSCLRELFRVLYAHGLLSIAEQLGDPDFIPLLEVRILAEKAGFEFEQIYGKNKNYTANFRKPDKKTLEQARQGPGDGQIWNKNPNVSLRR